MVLINDDKVSQVLGSLAMTVLIIFGGNLANLSSVSWSIQWIKYISFIYYSYAAFMQNELNDLKFFSKLKSQPNTIVELPGRKTIESYELDEFLVAINLLLSFCAGISFLILGYFAIRATTKPKGLKLASTIK